jgi:glycosyltransferase involved in cell wall biosynthesis
MSLSQVIFYAGFATLLIAFANIVGWPRISRRRSHESGIVSILIPARNEESNLGPCLDAALKQGKIVREILVYDDHSTDATPRIIAQYAGHDSRIRPVTPVPLEAGWSGKNFACFQLAKAASSGWLLFIDADARFAPAAVERMQEEMRSRNLSFLSAWPGLEMQKFWERTLMPMLNFVVFSIFPAPLSLHFNFPSLALAHGACLMFERRCYFEVGGHAAVRDQIFEDTQLARLWRARKHRGLCLDGSDVVRVRMYSSFREIWLGFEKNFFPAFQFEASFWLFIGFHFAVFLLPFVLLIWSPGIITASAVAVGLLTRLLLALRFRHSLLYVLMQPISEAVLVAIGLASWWKCSTGRGVVWKGREYFSSRHEAQENREKIIWRKSE